MNTFSSIIEDLGGGAVVGLAINAKPGTVRQWKIRDWIPAQRWQKIVQLADAKGKDGITYEQLAKLADQRKPKAKRKAKRRRAA